MAYGGIVQLLSWLDIPNGGSGEILALKHTSLSEKCNGYLFFTKRKKELIGMITTHEGCVIIQPIVEFATTQRHDGYKCFFFFFFGLKRESITLTI